MNRPTLTGLLLGRLLVMFLAHGNSHAADHAGDWPQWRGPLGTGVAPVADSPVEWSETKNVRWKVGLPGKENSTPIVWGDCIFLTTAVPLVLR